MNPLQCSVTVVFSKPICVTKAKIEPPRAKQGISTASHNNHHVHVTLQVTLYPPLPVPPFLLMQNLCTSTYRLPVQYDVNKSA